jgi:hypothetical protein
MTQNWNTIRRFEDPATARIAASKLQSEGIEVFLADEKMVGLNSLYSNAVGGVRLQVHGPDIERATEILGGTAEISEAELAEEATREPPPDRGFRPGPELVCPKCSSREVSRTVVSRKFAALTLALLRVFPLPYFRRRAECRGCGHSWKP